MKKPSEKPANNTPHSLKPYLLINLLLGAVILAVFAYSAWYSPAENAYPVSCIHKELSGRPCPTCGLSHSFSAMLRMEVDDARNYSSVGPRIFFFFFFQLLARMGISIWLIRFPHQHKRILFSDAVSAALLFCWAFYPLARELSLQLIK